MEKLLTTKDVCAMLSIGESTLRKLRADESGPPFRRIGTRSIRYELTDVESWLKTKEVR